MAHTNNSLPYILKGYRGDNLFSFPEDIWGMVRIGDEIFASPYSSPKKIYVIEFGTFRLKRILNLADSLWGYGSLGTDGEKLYARLTASTYMIKELNKQTGEVMGNVVQPSVNISSSIGSFYINRDWNMLFMPNYNGYVYCFDATTGAQLSFNSTLASYTSGITLVNKEYIAVSCYSTNRIYLAKIPNYETFKASDFANLRFEDLMGYGYTPLYTVVSVVSFGEFLLYTSYTYREVKWISLRRHLGDEVHPERYLVQHDSKYKTFYPYGKIKGLTNLVPVLTSNTSNGVASASSINSTTYEAWNAFDNSDTTAWMSANNHITAWLAYEFATPTAVNAYTLECREDTVGETPKTWDFEGFDGSKWVRLDRRVGEVNWQKDEIRVFTFQNTVAYKKYRIRIYESNGNMTYVTIQNLRMYYVADNMSGWMDYSTTTPTNLGDIFIKGIKDISKIREEDWNILASINPNIKVIRYVEKQLHEFSEFKSDLMTMHEGYANVLVTQFTPLNQVVIPLDNISINEDIEKFDVVLDKEYHDKIRLFVSFDNGLTWESFKKGNWISVDTSNETDILNNGMKVWEFESLRTKNFKSKISYGFIKVGFMIETDVLEKGITSIDSIQAYIHTYMNGADISKMSFYILNTTSTINLTFIGNKLSGTLNDYDMGLVQYRVFLNGKPYYPLDGSFTTLDYSPEPIALNIKNKDVLMNQRNELIVEFKDYWGYTDTWTTHFIGTYAGLMFADPKGNFYTTDIGEILKYLNIGTLTAGQVSVENKIQLINMYGHKVKDIEIKAMNAYLPYGVKVELSKDQYPFIAEETLTWNTVLDYNKSLTFWLRLATDYRANSVPNGKFEVRARATKV